MLAEILALLGVSASSGAGFLIGTLYGLCEELWNTYQANKALVNRGAEQQRDAEAKAEQLLREEAERLKNATDQKSDADVDADLRRW